MNETKRIGILVINPKYPTKGEIITVLAHFNQIFEKLIILSEQELEAQLTKDICGDLCHCYPDYVVCESPSHLWSALVDLHVAQMEQLVFFDNSFFGLPDDWKQVMKLMAQRPIDFWGLLDRGTYKNEYSKVVANYIEPFFIVVNRSLFLTDAFKQYLDATTATAFLSKEFTYYFAERQYHWDIYIEENEDNNTNTFHEDRLKYLPYELMKEKHLPVLSKAAFHPDRIDQLEFHYGNQLCRALNYIKRNTSYEIREIYQYMLSEFTPYENKNMLNLDYVFKAYLEDDESCKISSEIYKRTAIAAHLYYRDLFYVSVSYLAQVPREIHLYITVADEAAKRDLEQLLSKYRDDFTVIVSSNCGRDWGALILDLWPKLSEYEYICFIHDKKTTGGKGYESVGKSFMEMTFDQMLQSKDYIDQILDEFEKFPQLGLLSPVLPYHSGYIKLLGDAWTVCYDKTKALAEELKLDTKMSEQDMPFALSSMFWFKKDALQPILNYGFTNEDFPKEPMAMDGTFNHALERIGIYCAQSQGYFAGTVQTRDSAQNNLTNYEFMLHRVVQDALKAFGDLTIKEMFSGNNYQNRIGLIKFIMSHEKNCIYGAGNNGKNAAQFIMDQGLAFECFAVSDGFSKEAAFMDHPVHYFSEIDKEMGIIIAIDKKNRQEVIDTVVRAGVKNYYVLTS
jgi:rhamnosyltransferase